MTGSIPAIDLDGLDTDAGLERIAREFDRAYGELGFAYVINHGVPAEVTAAVFQASARFHALPIGEKRRIAINEAHRGYIELATSTDRVSSIEEATLPNHSESFIKLHEAPPGQRGRPLQGPNQWPDGLPGFREAVETYEACLERLARRLVAAFGLAFAGDAGALAAFFAQPTTWLRLLHYPARPADAPAGLFGSAPHTDFGALTILAQDAAGGLQVRGPDGAWRDVPPRPDAFVVNAGDLVPVWSGGRWRSTPHRVINPSGAERYSIAYFFDPALDTVVRPLANSGGTTAPIRFEDHVRAQLDGIYDYRAPDA